MIKAIDMEHLKITELLPIPNFFLPKQHFTRSFSNDLFIQANCNHDYYFYSFFPRTILDWNSLPSGIRTSTNFSLFKDHCFSAIRNIIDRGYLSIFFIFIYLIYLYNILYFYIFYIYWSRNNFIIGNCNNFILLYVICKCVFFLFFFCFLFFVFKFYYCISDIVIYLIYIDLM